jgi:chaperonin GroES
MMSTLQQHRSMGVRAAALVVLAAWLFVIAVVVSPTVHGLANMASGVGRFVLDSDAATGWQCHYDVVLVERIQGQPVRATGLFVPDAPLPKMHLCRVLSLGPGREEENGRIAPMPDIKIGDIVVAKNPWGIGPKDEETLDGKKLSYMRSQDIAAKITGGLVDE